MKVVTSPWLVLIIALVNCVSSSPLGHTQEHSSSTSSSQTTSGTNGTNKGDDQHASTGVHVASWNWSYVRTPFIYTSFLVIAGLCKVGFHHANFLSRFVPESCLLIVLGTIVGVILYTTGTQDILPHFDSTTFFLYLLPPIMLESSYSLHDRTFVANIGTILLYAVVGTLINCFTIGPTLYGLALAGAMGDVTLPLTEALTFSALISAVDPVAVLAIFQEVGVNKTLYFLVFGESLLNDAVTVVLYNMMVSFSTMETIPADQILLGVAVFLCVSIGGLLIGVIFGILTALLTKHTQEVRVMEPLVVLGIAYLSYLTAEMVHFSGIISIIGCGLVQAQYARNNISTKSYTTVKYFSKMLSATCDCIIFLFLGMVLVNDHHQWQTGFILWTVVLCLLYRFMSVFLLTFFVNKWNHIRQIDVEEQFIMAYGGLRGAVCFSLVVMLDDKTILNMRLFVTTTLVIILFTVFLQGATIKPLVQLLKVQRGSDGANTLSLSKEINQTVMDHVMAGVEEIIGRRGDFYFKQIAGYYHEKYLKKWLQRESSDFHNFCKIYEKLAIEDHYAHLYGPATALEEHKKLSLYSEDEDVFVENGDVDKLPLDDVVSIKKAAMMIRQASVSKRDSITQILSPISASPVRTSKDAVNVLQKAFQEHDYKRFQKYSPDMEEVDESEIISTQLRRRRLRTRRLTITAKSPTTSQHSSSQGDTIDPDFEGVPLRRRQPQPTSTLVQVTTPDTTKDFWLERANNRRLKMRSTNPTLQRAQTIDAGGGVPRCGGPSFQMFEFPRVDQSIRPRSTGDLEKRHLASLDTIDESDVNSDSANNDMQLQPLLTMQKSLPSTPPAPMAREESTESKKSLASPRPHSASTTPTSTSSSSKPRLKSGASTESASSRRKHRFSKSHPVDLEDSGDEDSNHESTV